MRNLSSLCLLLPFLFNCAGIVVDRAVNAADGHDATVVLGGCGQGFRDGYLLCRKTGKVSGISQITLNVPDTECGRDSCVEFHIIGPDGSVNFSGGMKSSTYVFELADVVGHHNDLTDADDGEYLVAVRVYYMSDGEEFSMVSRGFIRLVILKPQYAPMGCGD